MKSIEDPSMALLAASSTALLAASSGDTVKLFDVSVDSGDPCTLSYTPSPGCPVNSLKWNHTNLIVASAGDDKRISLWRKNGHRIGTIPVANSDGGDNIEESILSIGFSNRGSRYICSGGTGQVVRIWDLQRKRCIKWLRGHSDTITGVMYNCKDEHLASVSVKGDLVLHNLASGAKVTELKDPSGQVLRMLDYSKTSRHTLVTAGDDGSIHLWDATSRIPKMSWLRQHSAPTAGLAFCPSNDKVIVTVGLDKKLYTIDSSSRKPSFFTSYDAPFSSVAFRDDGWLLAAGTSNGRVVFYDMRRKPHPFTMLRAYNSSEAVSSLCWQRSKPIIVNEKKCTDDVALLGGAVEDSILMPDPLPPVTSSSSVLQPPSFSNSRDSGHLASSVETSFTAANAGSVTTTALMSVAEETPARSHLLLGGTLARLNAPRGTYKFKDDMEVFSPLIDVHPITPSVHKVWDDHDVAKKGPSVIDKYPSSLSLSSSKRYNFVNDGSSNQIFEQKSSSMPEEDDARSSRATFTGSTPANLKTDDDSVTPPEAWGGERLSDIFASNQTITFPSRFSMFTSGSAYSTMLDQYTSQGSMDSSKDANMSFGSARVKDISSKQLLSSNIPEGALESLPPSVQKNVESLGSSSLSVPSRRFAAQPEKISSGYSLGEGTFSSPKMKKTGLESREELLNDLLSRSDTSAATVSAPLPSSVAAEMEKVSGQSDSHNGSSFTVQLFQRTLEQALASFQGSIHEDVRNLHIEILRQFHIHENEMSSIMNTVLQNQAELMREVQSLRKENQKLRDLL